MGITTSNPPRLLDLTRLVSRAGRPMTGVDRVEFAYLAHLSKTGSTFGLVRSAFGYLLLDPEGCRVLHDKITQNDWGRPDRLSGLKRGLDPIRARAESDLRRICRARCLPVRLSAMMRRHLPPGTRYINVGHSNLTNRVLSALRQVQAHVTVMIHDTIPLDLPDHQRPGSVLRFQRFLSRATAGADLILCNSRQTRHDLIRHLGTDAVPTCHVAPLGVDLPLTGTPPEGPWRRPYFITIGTIEPRKNHALLLDIWPNILDADLLICGSRGWENQATFAALDAHPPHVHEISGLSDPALFGLLQGAAGLLFPSIAEGYGLPPIEAATLNVQVICNDLPIYREILGDIPIYADVADRYLWITNINKLAKGHRAEQTSPTPQDGFSPPTWEAHFKAVLTLT